MNNQKWLICHQTKPVKVEIVPSWKNKESVSFAFTSRPIVSSSCHKYGMSWFPGSWHVNVLRTSKREMKIWKFGICQRTYLTILHLWPVKGVLQRGKTLPPHHHYQKGYPENNAKLQMVLRFQFLSSWECWAFFHAYYFEGHSDPEGKYLLESYLWVKLIDQKISYAEIFKCI